MKIIGLYSGLKESIGPRNSPTGIFKMPKQSVQVNKLGIVGDVQVDKRFHGGPEQALHQYALSSYEKIIKWHPLLHQTALSGSMGENLSTSELNEKAVCIGDVYQLGSVIIQVSCPRMPCWKIDAKFKQVGLSEFVLKHKIVGWYYRVIQEGDVSLEDHMHLLESDPNKVSIDQLLSVALEPQDSKLKLYFREKLSLLNKNWAKQHLS